MLPEAVGPYRVEAMLGEGGMGVVYRGVDPSGEHVAVKVLRAALRSEALVARFRREAQGRVEHPNVGRVLEAGTDAQGTPFIAFELLAGETLAERLLRSRATPSEVVDWGTQACAGLAAAHALSIVHRDVKPSNLFLCEDGTLKVIDFGVALLGDAHSRLTQTGAVPGTVGYLSPEQAQGEPRVDARSDLWSLGAVLYEALTGAPPFAQPTPLATMVATLMAELVPIRVRAPSVPDPLARVIERALARDPHDRHPSAEALGAALRGATVQGVEEAEAGRPGAASSGSIRPGERRVVALLFAEGVRDAEVLGRAVGDAGGALLRLVGDRALGLFGAERWEGDEIERAAKAALGARPAAARVSVSSGWATSTGASIAGAALEAAERCSAAGLGGVALDAEAARTLRDRLPVVRVGDGLFELRLDGGDERGDPEPFALVGREAEMAQLESALRSVTVDKRPLVTLITGPPGIGASRLRSELERVVSRDAQATLLSVAASPREREADLSLLRAIARAAGMDLEDVDVRGDATTGVDIARARDRLRLSIFEGLQARAEDRLLVLSIDDLQWADLVSLEILEDLVDEASHEALLIVGAARSDLLGDGSMPFSGRRRVVVEPRPLTREDVATLAALVAGSPLRPDLADALAERTSGNPFFVIQSVRALEDARALDGEPEALPLPATVEAAIQSRLDQLPREERELCRRVSIWGRPFDLDEAGAVGVPDPEPLLESLVKRDLMAKRGRRRAALYHFEGALIAEVARRSLVPDLERELHRAAAAHLGASCEADPEERARHHAEGGEEAAAAAAYTTAARAAVRRGDCQSALRCAGLALSLGVAEDARFELHALRIDALRFLGRPDELGAAVEAALASAGSDAQRARALSERAVWLCRAGHLAEALSCAEDALRTARDSGSRDARVLAGGRRFLVLEAAGRTAEAEEALAAAVAEARDADPMLRATALGWRAYHLATSGDLAARLAAFVELAELYEDLGDVRRAAGARANLADAYNRLGAYRAAEEALAIAVDDCHRVGHRTMEGYTQLNLAYARIGLGAPEGARDPLAAAERIARDTGEARLAVLVRVYRARALLAAADESGALAAAEEAIRLAAGSSPDLEVGARTLAARAHLRLGQIDAALDESSRALEAYEALGGIEEDEAEVFLARMEALRAAGRNEEAEGIRRRGRERVESIAGAISDAELRASFLRNVPAHASLAAAD